MVCFGSLRAPTAHGASAPRSMIPKSGTGFRIKIMLKRNKLDHDPIQLNRIMI
jgi:hypothetical protein